MDQRLKEALEYSNYRLSLATHKKNIRLRAEAIQLVSESGGMFRANEQLILWLDYLAKTGASQYVLVDINDQPVMIQNIPALRDRLHDAYTKSMNLMHAENEKIKRARDVAKVVNAPADTENKGANEEDGSSQAA
jgi:Tfp pilus assembly PilM family ATPase